ncbi:MAG: hypothetical protein ACI35S_05265 [Anaeroplasma sp.]
MAKIDILISSKGSAKESDLDNSPANGGQSPIGGTGNTKLMAKNVAANQLAKVGFSAIKSTFDFATSNYGNFTGDYIGQQKIDNVFSIASTITKSVGTIATGAMAGGLVGAAVAAVAVAVDTTMSAWQNNINYNQSLVKANFSASFNAARIGTVLNGGNRQ